MNQQKNMGQILYIETLEWDLERGEQKQENQDYICKNIVDAYFQRRIDIIATIKNNTPFKERDENRE